MKTFNWRGKKGTYIISLITMLILMSIFLKSFYWPVGGVDKRKILVGILVFIGVGLVPILAAKISFFHNIVQKCIDDAHEWFAKIKEKKLAIVSCMSWALMGFGASGLLTMAVSKIIFHKGFNSHIYYALLAVVFGILFLVSMWKETEIKPEKVFVLLAVVMGVFCISVTPCRVGVSWDDEIHYAKTLEISNALNGIMYQADDKNIEDYGININTRQGYDRESATSYTEELNSMYEAKEYREHAFSNYGVWSVSYIPAAIGIILARGLGFSYVGVFNMGRLLNLLVYVLLIYLAIRKVKYGKVLIGCIGLIPTTIFMAASYSYDPWVTGFTILGYAYLIGELQDDTPLQYKNILMMVGMIIIGCTPKAIYFPLLFPLLFMPKKKFVDSKQKVRYYTLIILGGLLLVSTFLLPMLIGGAGEGDLRGGSDVNSTEQIKFILENPMLYAKILFEYIRGYIALDNSGAMLQRLAYIGHGYLYSTVALILPVVAFLDRGANEKNYSGVKISALIGCAATVILSTTALYISFTAVGSETVAGMQGRYLIPTIYPALYALGIGGVSHKINKKIFVCVPMIMIALTFFYNMIGYCVVSY